MGFIFEDLFVILVKCSGIIFKAVWRIVFLQSNCQSNGNSLPQSYFLAFLPYLSRWTIFLWVFIFANVVFPKETKNKKKLTCFASYLTWSSRLYETLFELLFTCDCKRICDINSFKRPYKKNHNQSYVAQLAFLYLLNGRNSRSDYLKRRKFRGRAIYLTFLLCRKVTFQ